MPPLHDFNALWDTGATGTVISQAVVTTCGLKPTGMVTAQSAYETKDVETYLVNVYLPNSVAIQDITVTGGLVGGSDVLIGMDIIGLGSFAVSNYNGKTTFTFRVPSDKELDFVLGDQYKNAMAQQLQNRQQRRGPKSHRHK